MSNDKPSYLWAAFNARPFGMPIPPNWFGLAALGMMGVFLSPGFLVLGAGLEIAYLAALSTSKRFRNVVDAGALQKQQIEDPADRRYREMLEKLSLSEQRRQQQVEARAREILAMLKASPMMSTHADSLEQLVWLHLRLLAARQAIARVVQTAQQERAQLAAQEDQIRKRLESATIGVELRRSLEQQVAVIDQRQEALRRPRAGRRRRGRDGVLGRIAHLRKLADVVVAHEDAGCAAGQDDRAHRRVFGERADLIQHLLGARRGHGPQGRIGVGDDRGPAAPLDGDEAHRLILPFCRRAWYGEA